LSSSTAALRETADIVVLYFDPYSYEDLFNKINLITNNSNIRKELIKKSNARSQYFSWKKCAEETLEIYNSVL